MGIYMNSQFSDGDKVTQEDSEGLGTGKQTGDLKDHVEDCRLPGSNENKKQNQDRVLEVKVSPGRNCILRL